MVSSTMCHKQAVAAAVRATLPAHNLAIGRTLQLSSRQVGSAKVALSSTCLRAVAESEGIGP